jgi:hypothetical protein
MMEATRSSESLFLTRATQHHIPEDCILHSHRHWKPVYKTIRTYLIINKIFQFSKFFVLCTFMSMKGTGALLGGVMDSSAKMLCLSLDTSSPLPITRGDGHLPATAHITAGTRKTWRPHCCAALPMWISLGRYIHVYEIHGDREIMVPLLWYGFVAQWQWGQSRII